MLIGDNQIPPYAQAMEYLAPEGTLLAVGLPPDGKLEIDIALFVGRVCIHISIFSPLIF